MKIRVYIYDSDVTIEFEDEKSFKEYLKEENAIIIDTVNDNIKAYLVEIIR